MRIQHLPLLALAGGLVALSGGPGLAMPARSDRPALGSASGLVPTVVPCGVRALSDVAAPASPAPAAASPATVVSHLAITDFAISGSQLSVLTGNSIQHYTLTGTSSGSIKAPGSQIVGGLAVDNQGDSYTGGAPNMVFKLSPTGSILWSHTVGQQVTALWSTGTGASWRLGVVSGGTEGSTMFDEAGNVTGTSPVTGTMITDTGGVVYAGDGEYVRVYRNGQLTQTVGDPHMTNDPQPQGGAWHFYQQGGIVPASDGSILVADGSRGIDELTARGYYRGLAPDVSLGLVSQQSRMLVVGTDVWYVGGGRNNSDQGIFRIPMASLQQLANAPAAPSYVLGPGAGVATGQVGNIIPAGHQPQLTASFDPWWAGNAPGLRLSYTVQNSFDATDGIDPAATVMPLPTTSAALASIPLTLPKVGPGSYQLDARLLDRTGVSVGATCLYFSVASSMDRLDLAALPGAADFGGPSPERAVALADELGTGGARVNVDWTQLLPGGAGSTAPENFSAYDAAFKAAAASARQRGVSWWVQVGAHTSDGIAEALIANGSWGKRVTELVAHFRGVVPAWEAFNEPNNGVFTPVQYVDNVLKPFSQAVRAGDPAAKVIGGSTLNVSLPYWQGIAAAGGLSMIDIAGVHAYTGDNRSWEEQGIVPDLQSLRKLVGRLPIWTTESAWWADGPANFFSQGDKAARAAIWMRVLGMGPWSYFVPEGGFGDYGFSYSLIQSDSTLDNYAKPGALSLQQESAELRGRTFLGMVATGIPHAYAAHFGPAEGGDGEDVLASWTDDADITARLSVTKSSKVTATDEYGAVQQQNMSSSTPLAFTLRPSVSYLSYPGDAGLVIGPTEAYGNDLVRGAMAGASSSAPSNPASAAVDGVGDAGDGGDLSGLSAWASAVGDKSPTLTVTLPASRVINRVDVLSSSLGSLIAGLRDYDVEVSNGGAFHVVASVTNDVAQRTHQLDFAPTMTRQIRLVVLRVATSGFAGGDEPWFPVPAQAVVYALEAYGGTADVATLGATSLPAFGPSPDGIKGPVADVPSTDHVSGAAPSSIAHGASHSRNPGVLLAAAAALVVVIAILLRLRRRRHKPG